MRHSSGVRQVAENLEIIIAAESDRAATYIYYIYIKI